MSPVNRTITISLDNVGGVAIACDPPLDSAAAKGQLDARQALQMIALNDTIDDTARRAIARSALDPTDQNEDSFRHDTPLEVVIAATCHEANRQYCRSLGDYSHAAWKDTPGPIQASTIEGVRNIITGAATTPAETHARWMASKLQAGWTYGPQKDFVAKTHPSLVEYEQLSAFERQKDVLFFAIATGLLGAPASATASRTELAQREAFHRGCALALAKTQGVVVFWTEIDASQLTTTAADQRETIAQLFAGAETDALAYLAKDYPAMEALVPNPSEPIATSEPAPPLPNEAPAEPSA